MIYTKLPRIVFLALAMLFAGAASAQELVAVTNSNEPASAARGPEASPQPASQASSHHKLGPLDLSVNWRFRTEAWDWFQAPTPAQNTQAFEHSLLRVGLGQKSERFEWFVEGAQDAILDLPTGAILAGRPGQLGLGGTYFAANGRGQNNANGFVRQAYVAFVLPSDGKLKLGRFTFLTSAPSRKVKRPRKSVRRINRSPRSSIRVSRSAS